MRWRIVLVVLTLFLSACASQPAPTPTPTRTPRPAAPAATATPAPTDTAAPPPTPVPTDTPAATATPTPIPTNVNPLTGLVVDDPAVLERRPIDVKISNAPGVNVRPHSGINSADVVFEHIAEYGVTRLAAIYLGNDADPVGSVRSCRIIDKEIIRMFHAALACSGLSNGNYAGFRQLPEFDEGRILSPSYGDGAPMFYRLDNGQGAPHNMFVDTPTLWQELTTRGINGRQDIRAWIFAPQPPAGGKPAATLDVDYKSLDSQLQWRYDPAGGLYQRWQAGDVFSDKLTGQQTTASNVLVVYALHIATDIVEDDNGGALSIEIQLWGQGDILVFRDGQMYKGHWVREDSSLLFKIVDDAGQPIPLKPGQTWVQVVYATSAQTTTNTADGWTVDTKVAP